MQQRIVRVSVLDVVPQRPLGFAARITGRAMDVADGTGVRDAVEVELTIDESRTITRMVTPVGDLGRTGESAGRGFRAALETLRNGTSAERLLRRLLWDVPIVAQVAGQTALLDHDRARADLVLDTRGADQCSGWRSGGQMLRQVAGNEGVLVMPLGPARSESSVAEAWLPDVPPLDPMATRRSRLLEVDAPDESGRRVVSARFGDSYTDPDGVQRALHEWSVLAEFHPDEGRFGAVSAAPGRLPWVECPFAGSSADRLRGMTPAEVDDAIGGGFAGIGTCTHLNDTLRSLADVDHLARA